MRRLGEAAEQRQSIDLPVDGERQSLHGVQLARNQVVGKPLAEERAQIYLIGARRPQHGPTDEPRSRRGSRVGRDIRVDHIRMALEGGGHFS